jgi:hypothetical protein
LKAFTTPPAPPQSQSTATGKELKAGLTTASSSVGLRNSNWERIESEVHFDEQSGPIVVARTATGKELKESLGGAVS